MMMMMIAHIAIRSISMEKRVEDMENTAYTVTTSALQLLVAQQTLVSSIANQKVLYFSTYCLNHGESLCWQLENAHSSHTRGT